MTGMILLKYDVHISFKLRQLALSLIAVNNTIVCPYHLLSLTFQVILSYDTQIPLKYQISISLSESTAKLYSNV